MQETRNIRRLQVVAIALVALAASAVEMRAQDFTITSADDPVDTIETGGFGSFPGTLWTDSGDTFYMLWRGILDEWRVEGLDYLKLLPAASGNDITIGSAGGLVLSSENFEQRYLADAAEDNNLARHTWYENETTDTANILMQLTQGDGGRLYTDGPVTQNHTFDLAEMFWEQEDIEPGELVSIHPGRANAVRLTSGAYEPTVLGVASTRPGFILGGGAFSLEEFGETWGAEIAAEYEDERRSLELKVFAELPELETSAQRLASQGAFKADLARARAEQEALFAAEMGGEDPKAFSLPTREEIDAAYEAALARHENVMFDETLRQFFSERFTAVALAGRVPVKADATFGDIQPGDYLTSSPIPGVAMKARREGPVVGTALEALRGGSGIIEVFVHRGWYGGGGVPVGEARPAGQPEGRRGTDAKDREIADLKVRLALLERKLDRLTTDGSIGEWLASRGRVEPEGTTGLPLQ